MTNFYKELGIPETSSPEEIHALLDQLLKEARYEQAQADGDPELLDQAEEKIINIRGAKEAFRTEETKKQYDEELEKDRQARSKKAARESSKYTDPDERLLDLLREAVEKEDYSEVKSIAREFELRGCESAEFYAMMCEAYAKQNDLEQACEMAAKIEDEYSETAPEYLLQAYVVLADFGMEHSENDNDESAQEIIRAAIDGALQFGKEAEGFPESLDIRWDLKHGNEAMAFQKARTLNAQHPEWVSTREIVGKLLIMYTERKYLKPMNDNPTLKYFDSPEDYENYSQLMHLAADIYPENMEHSAKIQESIKEIDAMKIKKLIPGALWAIGGPLTIGLGLSLRGDTRVAGFIFFAIAVVFYIGLKIPQYMMPKYLNTKELDGGQGALLALSKPFSLLTKLMFWPVTLMLRYKKKHGF